MAKLQRRSPLAGFHESRAADAALEVTLEERPFKSLTQICIADGKEDAVAEALGVALPAHAGESGAATDSTVLHVGPRRYWLLDEGAEKPVATALEVMDGVYTLDITHARTRFTVLGEKARALLQKGLMIDLHPAATPAGRVIMSVIAKVQVCVLVRANAYESPARFDVFVSPAFAVSLWEWFLNAGAEFGIET